MNKEQIYDYERNISICEQELGLAKLALQARKILDMGYIGHGINVYQWQSSQLIEKLENALKHAAKLPMIERSGNLEKVA